MRSIVDGQRCRAAVRLLPHVCRLAGTCTEMAIAVIAWRHERASASRHADQRGRSRAGAGRCPDRVGPLGTVSMTAPRADDDAVWPALPYADWEQTCLTVHMWTQVVGKVKLALTPYLNQW